MISAPSFLVIDKCTMFYICRFHNGAALPLNKVKRAFLKLGCLVPPGVTHIRPMGASAHYVGTIPMTTKDMPYTLSEHCQSHDFENLFIVL